MGNHAAGELERGIGRVVCGRLVLLAVLVPAIREVRRSQATHRLHFAEEIVEHVAPVAQHVEDDAAAVLLAVVPRGALRGNAVALEYPVAEFAANGKDPAEEALLFQSLELQ